jgi:hypothetical protein
MPVPLMSMPLLMSVSVLLLLQQVSVLLLAAGVDVTRATVAAAAAGLDAAAGVSASGRRKTLFPGARRVSRPRPTRDPHRRIAVLLTGSVFPPPPPPTPLLP